MHKGLRLQYVGAKVLARLICVGTTARDWILDTPNVVDQTVAPRLYLSSYFLTAGRLA